MHAHKKIFLYVGGIVGLLGIYALVLVSASGSTDNDSTASAESVLKSASYVASNGCHFKTGNAIVCTDGQNAAIAYGNYGFDVARTDLDYNRALLRESGCGRAYRKTYSTAQIREFKHGRVALPDGWVGVSLVEVNGHDSWYVATDYLEGICEPYKPITTTLKQDYAAPDFGH